ncbi:Fic family protein [Peribacillus muralis]|uniref:Fic family protein n=1 Tax=Peribacillus muralis TaxID=264697 RepID=UPI003D039DA5
MRYYTTSEAFEIIKKEGITTNIQVFRRYLQNENIPGAFRKSKKEGWRIPEYGLREFIIGKKGEENMTSPFIKRSFLMKREGLPKEYLEDVLVRLAHHSTALEGNTISLPDTISILLYNTVPSQVNLREFYEVDNHREAFDYIMNQVQNEQSLTVNTIKDIHELLTNKLQHDRGQFKSADNAIRGASFLTASATETPYLMDQWVGNINWQLDQVKNRKDLIRIVGDFHIQFERIHPFSDGNGRTGRLVMNYSLLQHGIPPLIIEVKDKAAYINILANQDTEKFLTFAEPLIEQEDDRITRFRNKEKQQAPIVEIIEPVQKKKPHPKKPPGKER